MVFEEKHHMPWAYDAYEAYEAYEPNFREDMVNAFHRLLLPPPAGGGRRKNPAGRHFLSTGILYVP